MFPPTQPMIEAEPQPVLPQSPRQPWPLPGGSFDTLDEPPTAAVHTALSSLSPSLLQDLQRFDPRSPQRELLEVLAACMRHTQSLALELAGEPAAVTLTLFPLAGVAHCPLPLDTFLSADLSQWRVLAVRPASVRPPDDLALNRPGGPRGFSPLRPLLWAVALSGAREALLPELAGQAAYRVAPAFNLSGLDVPGAMAACITRLRRQTSNLGEIANWHGIGDARAMRLLNALYLQSGLIVSRTHPAATNVGWTGY